jgi:pyruvate dehydrogenase E2 component (dihydrolipoamide acetyltransferase)
MEEGVLVRWVKKEGDKVSPGDLVAEVETDKANMDFNMEDEGVLLKLLVKEGDTVKLGAPVAILGKAGEDVAKLVEEAGKQAAAPATTAPAAAAPPAPAPTPAPVAQVKAPAPAAAAPSTPKASGTILASPLAKTLAIELGVDLRTITGSGPGGRIVERDVRAAGTSASTITSTGTSTSTSTEVAPVAIALRSALVEGEYVDVPASNMRKRIAARLTEAKRDVPHFYLMRTLDAAPLLSYRTRLNDLLGDRGKVSVNDLIIKAVALALKRVPDCNASWAGEAIRRFHRVHVGVAVAIEDGLVTPVVRDADRKGIGAIAAEVKDLAERAKHRQLKQHEISGSTFTVSNLGMYGIERFTAILNPPEGGILAIGTVVDTPVVTKDGQIVAGKRMTVTMSCDHRVIDGALGAKWLAAFAELFEHPEALAL